jgi:hypothetical protein
MVHRMTIRYDCDGPDCSVVIEEGEARIELKVVQAEPPPDADPELLAAVMIEFGFTADHHFHNPACLASWAMARHLNESDTAP